MSKNHQEHFLCFDTTYFLFYKMGLAYSNFSAIFIWNSLQYLQYTAVEADERRMAQNNVRNTTNGMASDTWKPCV
jgi:hypothetical protein